MRGEIKMLLKGTLGGGLAMFLAHGFGWGALPFANRAIHDFNEPERLAVLDAGAKVQPGTYFVNANQDRTGVAVPNSTSGWMTLHPTEAYSEYRSLVLGLLINLMTALLASWLVLRSRGSTFEARLSIGIALTAFALLAGPVWDWAWGWYSGPYAIAVGLNVLMAGLASAAVVAWLVKPPLPFTPGEP